ncbi:aldo/keto reductase [Actinophytocola sediminis]
MPDKQEVPSSILPIGGSPVRRLGFGSMQITGPGHWNAPLDPDQAMRVLHGAIKAGVTHIDTADAYGPFVAEEYIRKVLFPYPDELVIATKGGLTRQGPKKWAPCGRPEYLRQCVEMSIRRLQVDRISLYYLHRIDPAVPMEDQLAVLAEMQAEGKIHHIGLSKVSVDQVRKASELVDIAAVQNKYNITNRRSEEVVRYCELNNVAFVPYGPLGSGSVVRQNEPLEELAKTFDITPVQLAIAWLLHRSSVIMPIPGTSSTEHLRENLLAGVVQLTAEEVITVGTTVENSFKPVAN